jgi:NAD(P)H-nitrite reductase large subunit
MKNKIDLVDKLPILNKKEVIMKNWEILPDNELVCYCMEIDKKTIVSAIKNGANSLSDIKKVTTACTGGRCKETNPSGKCCSTDILELIRIYGNNKKLKMV